MTDTGENRRDDEARPSPRPPVPRSRGALDPFFIFTYTLLAFAFVIQVFLMVWMDLF